MRTQSILNAPNVLPFLILLVGFTNALPVKDRGEIVTKFHDSDRADTGIILKDKRENPELASFGISSFKSLYPAIHASTSTSSSASTKLNSRNDKPQPQPHSGEESTKLSSREPDPHPEPLFFTTSNTQSEREVLHKREALQARSAIFKSSLGKSTQAQPQESTQEHQYATRGDTSLLPREDRPITSTHAKTSISSQEPHAPKQKRFLILNAIKAVGSAISKLFHKHKKPTANAAAAAPTPGSGSSKMRRDAWGGRNVGGLEKRSKKGLAAFWKGLKSLVGIQS